MLKRRKKRDRTHPFLGLILILMLIGIWGAIFEDREETRRSSIPPATSTTSGVSVRSTVEEARATAILKKEERKRKAEEARRAAEARKAKEAFDSNPLGLVDPLGRLVKNPLKVGDVASTAKDTMPRSPTTYAHLWLALEDRERGKWINTAGWGEGDKLDRYVEQLLACRRILPVPANTRVKILELKPPSGKDYMSTWFKVEVLEGQYEGESGWLSYWGLQHEYADARPVR